MSNGAGGKVNDLGALAVTPGQTFSITIGAAGAGGAAETDGSAGGNTTFGAYSSSGGSTIIGGYVDIITGTAYGVSGSIGIAGNKGRGKDKPRQEYGYYSYDGDNGSCYYFWLDYGGGNIKWLYGMGGSGGGAAAGTPKASSIGADGEAEENNGNGFATGGTGGTGATPLLVGSDATIYGSGGLFGGVAVDGFGGATIRRRRGRCVGS